MGIIYINEKLFQIEKISHFFEFSPKILPIRRPNFYCIFKQQFLVIRTLGWRGDGVDPPPCPGMLRVMVK